MSLTYTTNLDALPIIKTLIAKHFPDLAEAEVTFEVLDCQGGLKLHGCLVTDVVKIRNLADRAAGSKDVRIILDDEEWGRADKKRRTAMLDHALCHLKILRERHAELDDHGRRRHRRGQRENDRFVRVVSMEERPGSRRSVVR